MPESFFHLSASEQEEALQVAASASGRPPHLLEKDIWVVWALSALFESPIGPHLVFKGGTALSKAYRIIRRFSEDVDLTYDIRALAPQLVENVPAGLDVIPPSRSQQKRWTDAIRSELLPAWIRDQAHPILQKALENVETATSRFTNECIFIDYKPVASTSSYVLPRVMLEFGRARQENPPTRIKSAAILRNTFLISHFPSPVRGSWNCRESSGRKRQPFMCTAPRAQPGCMTAFPGICMTSCGLRKQGTLPRRSRHRKLRKQSLSTKPHSLLRRIQPAIESTTLRQFAALCVLCPREKQRKHSEPIISAWSMTGS